MFSVDPSCNWKFIAIAKKSQLNLILVILDVHETDPELA